jgi:hypothetical protein
VQQHLPFSFRTSLFLFLFLIITTTATTKAFDKNNNQDLSSAFTRPPTTSSQQNKQSQDQQERPVMTSTSSKSTLPLKDITISTSGRFPGTTQGAIQTRITSLGGTFSTKITPETSILITTEKDYQSEGGSTKVNAAREKGDVSIVGLGWLEETEKTGIKADEKDHSFDGAIGTATASTSAAGAAITDTATTATTTSKTRQPLSTKATKDKGKRKENQAEISSDEGEKDGPLESPTKKLKGVDGIALPGPGDVTALKVKGKPKSKTTAAAIDITDISDGKAGPSTSKSVSLSRFPAC